MIQGVQRLPHEWDFGGRFPKRSFTLSSVHRVDLQHLCQRVISASFVCRAEEISSTLSESDGEWERPLSRLCV